MKRQNLLFSILLIFLLGELCIFACLNPVGRSSVGEQIQIEKLSAPDFMRNLVSHEDRNYWEKMKSDIQADKQNYSPNNLAVALIHLGRVREAIKILEALESKAPGQYYTAANLGTAYELNGENQKALEWIKEGIKREEESHYGTEWLHVKILEAKLAMEKDPNWLKNNPVLGVNLNSAQTPQEVKLPIDHLGQQKTLREVEEALIYQLHERLEFVKPPEPIVARLLLDLSKVFSFVRTAEHAVLVKDLALTYGAIPEEIKDQQKIAETENKANKDYIWTGILALIGVLVLGVVYALFRKRSMM